jgi:O-antigen ligase
MKYNFIKINKYAILVLPFSLIFSIFVSDLIVSLSSLSFLIYIFANKKISLLKSIEFKLFLILYTIFILSALFSDFTYHSLIKTLPYLRFGIFMLLIKYLLINDDNFKVLFFRSLLISLSVLCFGLFLQIIGFEYLSKYINGSRYSSFFFDEMILGSYLVKILPIVLALSLFLNYRFFFYILIIILPIMIFLSGERSALLSLIMFLSFLLIFTKILKIYYKLTIISLILILFVSTLAFFPKIKFRIIDQTAYQLNLIEPDRDYMEFELEDNYFVAVVKEEYFIPLKYYLMMESAFKMFKDNVFFGTGMKTFKILCKDEKYYKKKNYKAFEGKPDDYYKGFTGLDNCSTHPHNYYIQLLSETGFFSFLFVLIIFILFSYKFFREVNLYNKILYLSLMVSLFPFFFTGNIFNNFLSILIYLNMGFLNINNKKIK